MTRKINRKIIVFCALAISLLIAVFVVLYIAVLNKSNSQEQINETIETAVENTEAKDTTIMSTVPAPQDVYQIIRDEGLIIDSNGNVVDADGVIYTVVNGAIKIMHNGNIYTVSVSTIRDFNSSADTVSDKDTASSKSDINNDINNSNSSSGNVPQKREQTQSAASETPNIPQQPVVSETPEVVQRPTSKPNGSENKEVSSDIRMNYRSLTVNKGDIFNLTLIGAGNSVNWNVSEGIVRLYEKDGNKCSFVAQQSGSTEISALYNGQKYICLINII